MASSSESLNDITVAGFPSPANHPAPAGPTTTSTNEFVTFRPLQSASSVYRPAGSAASNNPLRDFFLLLVWDFFLSIISVVAFLCFVAYFAFRPLLPEFRVVSASVSHLNLTQSELTAKWFFELNIKNPNEKRSVGYERLEASVFFGDELELARTQLPPLLQGPSNESTVEFQLGVISEYVGDNVVKKISKEGDRDLVEFGVRVLGFVRFSSGGWRMRGIMRVYCDSVRIGNFGLNGTGTSLIQSERCDVYW